MRFADRSCDQQLIKGNLMNARILALGISAILATNVAHASVLFDTIDAPAGPSTGYDGPVSDSTSIVAASFSSATPNFSQISLMLAADTPNDGGSSIVYLVPDNGSGGSLGVAGSPTFAGSYTSAVQLGTIADNSLALAGSGSTLVTLNVSYATDLAVAANTHDKEYWVALVPSGTSSVDWLFNDNGAGVGTTNQLFFNNNGGTLGTLPDSDGAYEMLVDTPEPGTLALFGSGLASIGYFRRRGAKKA